MNRTVVKSTDYRYTDWTELYGWCCQRFGQPHGDRWGFGETSFYFADPADAIIFRLRWA